jgi:hypothetical protein
MKTQGAASTLDLRPNNIGRKPTGVNINALSGLDSANILPALSGERSSGNIKPKSAVTTKRRIEQQSSPSRDIPAYLASTF